jgi:hypothetical protein
MGLRRLRGKAAPRGRIAGLILRIRLAETDDSCIAPGNGTGCMPMAGRPRLSGPFACPRRNQPEQRLKMFSPRWVRDRLRTTLKIRNNRMLPRRGRRPSAGARIFCRDLRMTVQAGMTVDLWRWLQDAGWRELAYKSDRRRYRELSARCVADLIACAPEERSVVLDRHIAQQSR